MSFDLRRLRAPDVLTGLAGAALLVVLFAAPWYTRSGLGSVDGWHSLSHLRWLLLVVGALGVGSVLLTVTQRTPAIPVAVEVLVFVVSLVALIWLAVRVLISRPGANGLGDVDVGGWVGLAAALGLVAGSWWSMGDESPGRVPEPTDGPSVPSEIRPAPPVSAGPGRGDDPAGESPAAG